MKKEQKREIFADLIRSIAIFFVIIIHTTSNYLDATISGSNLSGYNITLILNSITSIAVVLFFMISGCFLIKKNSELDKKHFKKVLKRIYQLLFWSTIYLIFLKFYRNWDIDLWYSLKAQFFSSQVSHMWFMYPLLALYLLNPIVSKLYYSLNKKQLNYLLIVTFLIPLIIKTFIQYFNFVQMPQFAVGFSEFGYFILGKYIYDNYENLTKKIKIVYPILFTIIGIVLIVVYAKIDIKTFGMTNKPFFDYSRFPVALYCVSFYTVFVCLKSKLENIPDSIKKIINNIGKNSGGIYYIHMFVLFFIGNVYIGPLGFTSNEGRLLFMLLGALLYFIVSLIIVNILKRIPILKELVN